MTQQGLAEEIGIPRDRLSTYEKGRAPLKCSLALRICRQLVISEEWLATGDNKTIKRIGTQGLGSKTSLTVLANKVWPRHCLDLLSEPIALSIPPGTLFSVAFDLRLQAVYTEMTTRDPFFFWPRIIFTETLPEPGLAGRVVDVMFGRYLIYIEEILKGLKVEPWPAQRQYFRAIFAQCQGIYTEFARATFEGDSIKRFIPGEYSPFLRQKKEVATETNIQNNWRLMANALNHWPQLRKEIANKTTLRGSRASLARVLCVTPQVLNEWLQGRSAPPAEQTLRLLQWVRQPEVKVQQKKSAGGAAAPPAPKTQKGKSSYEKIRPGPKKR